MMLKKLYWNLEAFFFEWFTRYFLKPKITHAKHSLPKKLIVSLTSYKPRFTKVDLTIKTLLAQSIKPDHILLWVAYEDKPFIPLKLLELEAKFEWFEIKFCENLKSYKKIIPCLELYPDVFIVTADDDIYYPANWLRDLCAAWQDNYNEVVAYRCHKVMFTENGACKPYSHWQHCSNEINIHDVLFPTTGAGVLYPPGIFFNDVLNVDLFSTLCPNADDIWLFWMINLNGGKVKKTTAKLNVISWLGTEDNGLAKLNILDSGNDIQVSNMQKKYGNIKQYSDSC